MSPKQAAARKPESPGALPISVSVHSHIHAYGTPLYTFAHNISLIVQEFCDFLLDLDRASVVTVLTWPSQILGNKMCLQIDTLVHLQKRD